MHIFTVKKKIKMPINLNTAESEQIRENEKKRKGKEFVVIGDNMFVNSNLIYI